MRLLLDHGEDPLLDHDRDLGHDRDLWRAARLERRSKTNNVLLAGAGAMCVEMESALVHGTRRFFLFSNCALSQFSASLDAHIPDSSCILRARHTLARVDAYRRARRCARTAYSTLVL